MLSVAILLAGASPKKLLRVVLLCVHKACQEEMHRVYEEGMKHVFSLRNPLKYHRIQDSGPNKIGNSLINIKRYGGNGEGGSRPIEERLFSVAGNIVTAKRSLLKPKKLCYADVSCYFMTIHQKAKLSTLQNMV